MSIARLRKVCTNCKESSIKTYWANITALSKIAGKKDVPESAGWLNAALLKRVKEMPLQRRKRYATAGLKAAQMYQAKKPNWSKLMTAASEQYTRLRESGKRTKREDANWPKDGYKALKKLADEMHQEVSHLETKKIWNNRDLYRYQKYLIVRFYSAYALRGDLADVRIKKPFGSNWLAGTKGKYKIHVGEHKTARARGAIQIAIEDVPTAHAFRVFVPHAKKISHGFLLSTLRGSNRLTRQDMLRLIRNTTKERLGKNIGVQLIRVLKVSAHQKEIDRATELQKELGHSGTMQRRYISRD